MELRSTLMIIGNTWIVGSFAVTDPITDMVMFLFGIGCLLLSMFFRID